MSGELREGLSAFKLLDSESKGKVRRLAAGSSGDSSNSPKSSLKVRDVAPPVKTMLSQNSLAEERNTGLAKAPSLLSLDELRSTVAKTDAIPKPQDSKAGESTPRSGKAKIHADLTPTTPSPAPSPRTVLHPHVQSCYFESQHSPVANSSTARTRPTAPRTRSSDI